MNQGLGEGYEIPVPCVIRGHPAELAAMLLTVDAAYTLDPSDERALPGFLTSVVDTVRSVKKLHWIARRSVATVVTGHDPEMWPRFKLSPEAYDSSQRRFAVSRGGRRGPARAH